MTYLTPDIQASNIARPARNSGLNPSGNPLDSQLGRASEFLHMSQSTLDSSTSLRPMFDTDSMGAHVPGAAQGADGDHGICAYGAPGHQNEEPIFSTDQLTYNYDFQSSFSEPLSAQYSTATTSQEESALLGDRRAPSSSQGKFIIDCLGYSVLKSVTSRQLLPCAGATTSARGSHAWLSLTSTTSLRSVNVSGGSQCNQSELYFFAVDVYYMYLGFWGHGRCSGKPPCEACTLPTPSYPSFVNVAKCFRGKHSQRFACWSPQ
jgi:hypothetical protein